MPAIQHGYPILFGVPEPVPTIAGYLVIARPGEFLKARSLTSDRSEHYVRDDGDHWQLWRCLYDAQPTKMNPRGERASTEPPITIPKSS